MHRLRHPVRAIREPFGTAGLILACVALIAALGGSAWAAAKLNSTQKKEVEKIAKKFAGKPGAPGASGANGTSGGSGAKGEPGQPGKDGKSVTLGSASGAECASGGVTVEVEGSAASKKHVCNGQTGFTETLPEGETETGVFTTGFLREEAKATAPISFTIPLEVPLGNEEVHYVSTLLQEGKFGSGAGELCAGLSGTALSACEQNFESVLDACPGSAEEPDAAIGNLCVYQGGTFLPGEGSELSFVGIVPPTVGIPTTEISAQGADKAGALAGFSFSGAVGQLNGTWAVTAPES